jgi:hypothetical protein
MSTGRLLARRLMRRAPMQEAAEGLVSLEGGHISLGAGVDVLGGA